MFSPYTQSGFCKAPVSKGLLSSILVTSLALHIPLAAYRPHFTCAVSEIFEEGQIWKFVASKCAFFDAKNFICGAILIYYFRIFERRYGSQKFASHLLGCVTVSLLTELTVWYACAHYGLNITHTSQGPFCLIFPLFVPYFCDLPRVAVTHILGIPVTGKSFTYILGLQLSSDNPQTLVSAVCGLVAGILYRKNVLKIKNWLRIPETVARFCHNTLGKLTQSEDPKWQPMGATLELQRREQTERLEQQMVLNQMREFRRNQRPIIENQIQRGIFGHHRQNADEPNVPVPVPVPVPVELPGPVSDEQVRRLVEMGFQRENILHALQVTNNNLDMATNLLLQQA